MANNRRICSVCTTAQASGSCTCGTFLCNPCIVVHLFQNPPHRIQGYAPPKRMSRRQLVVILLGLTALGLGVWWSPFSTGTCLDLKVAPDFRDTTLTSDSKASVSAMSSGLVICPKSNFIELNGTCSQLIWNAVPSWRRDASETYTHWQQILVTQSVARIMRAVTFTFPAYANYTAEMNGLAIAMVKEVNVQRQSMRALDLTPYVLVGNDITLNWLVIHTTQVDNLDRDAFQIKIDLDWKQEIGNGICNPEYNSAAFNFDGGDCEVCQVNYVKISGACHRVKWISGAETKVYENGKSFEIFVYSGRQHNGWKDIDGANWVWVLDRHKDQHLTFTQSFYVSTQVFDSMKNAVLTASVDDFFTIWINGVQIAHITQTIWNNYPGEYPMTQYIKPGHNELKIYATNTVREAGLTFKIEISTCSPQSVGNGHCDSECNSPDFNFDGGDCLQCGSGFYSSNGVCTPLVWPSDTTTLVQVNGVAIPSALISALSNWPAIPGASFIWIPDNSNEEIISFTKNFALPESMKSQVTRVSIQIVTSTIISIYFNNQHIATTENNARLKTYDLTPYIKYSSTEARGFNTLVFNATNSEGSRGLSYKVTINTT